MWFSNIDVRNIIGLYREDEEAKYFVYELNDERTLLKVFKNDFNKKDLKEKLEIIDSKKIFQNDMGVVDIALQNGKTIGYFIPIDKDYTRSIKNLRRKKDKLMVLKKLRDKVEKLNKNGIYIGNFDSNNILVNDDNSDIKLYNLDNYKIENLDFGVVSKEMKEFYKKTKKIEDIDCFCLNLYTLELLEGINPNYITTYLNSANYSKNYEEADKNGALKYTILPNSYEKKYIIDFIK